MTKQIKGLIILLTPFVAGFLFGFLAGHGCSRDKAEETDAVQIEAAAAEADPAPAGAEDASSDVYEEPQAREIIYYQTKKVSYKTYFDDLNDLHLEKARKVGLSAVPATRDDVASLPGLTEISDNDYYVVDNLRYSVPYLTPGAAAELGRIAKAFSDSLARKNLVRDYKLVVTSVLRTSADVARLRRSGNPNASENSAHCYGTTFDITYTRFFREEETDEFMQPYELRKVLAEVLRDEKQAGRLLVKYEAKEHCFHITSCQ